MALALLDAHQPHLLCLSPNVPCSSCDVSIVMCSFMYVLSFCSKIECLPVPHLHPACTCHVSSPSPSPLRVLLFKCTARSKFHILSPRVVQSQIWSFLEASKTTVPEDPRAIGCLSQGDEGTVDGSRSACGGSEPGRRGEQPHALRRPQGRSRAAASEG